MAVYLSPVERFELHNRIRELFHQFGREKVFKAFEEFTKPPPCDTCGAQLKWDADNNLECINPACGD